MERMPVDSKCKNGNAVLPEMPRNEAGNNSLRQAQRVAEPPPPQTIQADAFITTTDIMNSINKSLHKLSTNQPNDNNIDNKNSCSNDDSERPFFELQRKLPDGSTRKATPSETAAANCQSQLQQAAQRVAQLKTWKEKAAWAEAQRQFGNALYERQEYAQAIDVYLTCLPAVDVAAFANNKKQQQANDRSSSVLTTEEELEASRRQQQQEQEECRILLLKILNNLAQSALQLQWYNKAEQFCSLALQHVTDTTTFSSTTTATTMLSTANSNSNHPTVFGEQVSKLYFRRGKARRLKGEYSTARSDLEHAMDWSRRVQEKRNDCDEDDRDRMSSLLAQQRAIEKEQHFLHNATVEARRNEQRQKQALRRALNNPNAAAFIIDDTPKGLRHRHVSRPVSSEGSSSTSTKKKKSLASKSPQRQQRRRQYSTLRAPPPPHTGEHDDEPPPPPLPPWQHYTMMVGKVAQKLLEMSTDDPYDSLRNHHVKLD